MNGYSLIRQCLTILASYQYVVAAPSAAILEATRQQKISDFQLLNRILASYQYVVAAPSAAILEATRQQKISDFQLLNRGAQITGQALSYFRSPLVPQGSNGGLVIHKIDSGMEIYYMGTVDDNGTFIQKAALPSNVITHKNRSPNTGEVTFKYGTGEYAITFVNIADAQAFMAA